MEIDQMPKIASPETAKEFASLTDVDPFSFYAARREEAPVVWDASAKAWLVTTFEHCRYIEINEHLFRHPYADVTPTLLEIKGGKRNITVLQGAEHDAMHRFLVSLFSPRAVKAYRDLHIRPIINELIERFARAGRAELTAAFSDKLPPRLTLSLLNMPWEDDAMVSHVLDLHNIIMAWASGQNRAQTTAPARAASAELNAMLLPHVLERKVTPGDDLISRVWTDWPQKILGEAAAEDAVAICREMFLAGSDTTVHALANAFYILLTDAAVMDAVKADRTTAMTNLIEESLRLYGAVQYRTRIANQDCEIGGVQIAKNDVMIVINSAANRDPAHYDEPDLVDLRRSRPHDHLAFNIGPRACVGAALARAEMADALNAVLDRLPNLRFDPAFEKPVFEGHFTRSYRPLHVLFDPPAGNTP